MSPGAIAYRGRFAPSPTGPLHFGSMVAALGSYLQARSAGGEWYVRIEDIDPPREVPGASDDILRTLEAYGLTWDSEVIYQSQRIDHYASALGNLAREGLAYSCSCTRREIREHNARHGARGTTVYPGLCRSGPLRPGRDTAYRLRVTGNHIEFTDQEVGVFRMHLRDDCGDFVLKRRDGLFAYQLAVVVDDADQRITEVVRGQDLLDSTPGQIYLQRVLGLPTPGYMHLPLVTNDAGQKLSKQTGARPLTTAEAPRTLHAALCFLGLSPPADLRNAAVEEIVSWGIGHWSSRRPSVEMAD
jgi:glutamyl-Q tRNA(Asp) synthetase